jgi:hypothetical protein
LYISSDGPRKDKLYEDNKVKHVREIVTKIDWTCELHTQFHHENYGCKNGVSSAIDWFFSKEEMGIILEDDCLPNSDFFIFCEYLLHKHIYDTDIYAISGNNFQLINFTESTYYFSKYIHIWGWATWRRAWQKNDLDIKFWPSWKNSKDWKTIMPNRVERFYWEQLFDLAYNNKIDTWDYSWIASVWYNNGISITPNMNLVTNLGFNEDATHTKNKSNKFSNLPLLNTGIIKYNDKFQISKIADYFTFNIVFEGYKLKFPFKLLYLCKRFIFKIINP